MRNMITSQTVVLVLGLSAASAFEELMCFVGKNANGILPDQAVVMTSQEWMEVHTRKRNIDKAKYFSPSFCQKSKRTTITKDFRTGKEQKEVKYSWGATEPRLTKEEIWACTDSPQSSHGVRLPHKEVVVFDQQCNCCGSQCNGHWMDSDCNKTPEFTHSCYSTGFNEAVDSPEIPADAVVVPATPQQFCYKLAHYNATLDTTFYMWGAANLGTGKKCGESRRMEIGSHIIQVCTCCGPLCNGVTMNSLNARQPCTAPAPKAEQKVIGNSASISISHVTVLLMALFVKLL